MLRSLDRRNLVAAWTGVLVAVAGAAAVSGVSVTIGNSALWFAVCMAPPAVMLLWRGAPTPTTQEIPCVADRRE